MIRSLSDCINFGMYINKNECKREFPTVGEKVKLVKSVSSGVCGENDYPMRFSDKDGKGVYLPDSSILMSIEMIRQKKFFRVCVQYDEKVETSSEWEDWHTNSLVLAEMNCNKEMNKKYFQDSWFTFVGYDKEENPFGKVKKE